MKKENKITYLVASDIHGNIDNLKILLNEVFLNKQEGNKYKALILLGDLYYSGPRNIPPKNYSPKQCVEELNNIYNQYGKNKLIAIKGNCEAEVDSMVSLFKINNTKLLKIHNTTIFLEHGHHNLYKKSNKYEYDLVLQGHTHIKEIRKENNSLILNPGSLGLNKDFCPSYLELTIEMSSSPLTKDTFSYSFYNLLTKEKLDINEFIHNLESNTN